MLVGSQPSQPAGGAAASKVPEGGRVVVLRALPGLGDTLVAIPAIRAIKHTRPDVAVTVVAAEAALPYWQRYPELVDRLVAFPGWPGLSDRKPDIGRIPAFLAELQAERFDLGIQLHGDGRVVNAVVALMGARRMAGHHPASEPGAPTGTWLPWRDGASEIRRWLRLMAALGFPHDDETPAFDITADVVGPGGIVRSLFPTVRHAEDRMPMAIVHPGSASLERRWPIERFARVADGLAAAGMRVAITGRGEDRRRSEQLLAQMRCGAIDLTGRTSLDELAEIMRRSSVVVCDGSGITHLAAALGTPSVVIVPEAERSRWAALDGRLHRPVSGSVEQVLYQVRRVAARARDAAA